MIFDKRNREQLEALCKEGEKIKYIAMAFGCSTQTIYNELKNGLSEEDIMMQKWIKYSAELSYKNQIKKAKERLG